MIPVARSLLLPASFRSFIVAAVCAVLAPLCAAIDAPVSPNAQPRVAQLLTFLDSVQGNYIVSGQQEIAWSQARKDEDFNYIIANTGKTPAVRGFDFLQYCYSPSVRAQQDATERAIAWAQNGGIVTFCSHMFMDIGSTNGTPQFYTPGSNGSPTGTNFDIRQAVIDGTPENIEYLAKLDIMATELKKLRDAGVPVIWRPFHECGGTWFWWSRYGAAPFIQAYQIMFNRYTQMHGLTNLIWVFNPIDSGATMQNWYPGDNYVDMISLDVYPTAGTHPTYATDSQTMRNFKNGRKVVAMSECGSIPDPDQLNANTVWSYFCTWNGFENDLSRHTVAFLSMVFNHAKVITLDELPAFYVPLPLASVPAFTLQPASTTAPTGASVTFSAAASGTPTPTFQWQKNGVNIAGATSNSYTIPSVTSGDAGNYTVVATNSAGSATSNGAALSIIVAPSNAIITITVE